MEFVAWSLWQMEFVANGVCGKWSLWQMEFVANGVCGKWSLWQMEFVASDNSMMSCTVEKHLKKSYFLLFNIILEKSQVGAATISETLDLITVKLST
jgi:hypothetical protein